MIAGVNQNLFPEILLPLNHLIGERAWERHLLGAAGIV